MGSTEWTDLAMSVHSAAGGWRMRLVWTAVGGLGGALTAVGLLTTFDSHNYGLGLPLLVVGLGILALWYVKHFRT